MMNYDLFIFYNLENFFPADHGLLDPQASGLFNWNEYKYDQKVKKISHVFSLIESEYLQMPSLIACAEVGNLSVLEDIKKNTATLKDYNILFEESNDSRGLNVGLIYDSTKIELLNYEFLHFPAEEYNVKNTRDILKAQVIWNNHMLTVFVLHLPSRRQQDSKKKLRNDILKKLKLQLIDLHKKGESAIVLGDFNDNPDSENLQELLLDDHQNPFLKNPFIELQKTKKYTAYHKKQGVVFDQIIYSTSLESQKKLTLTAKVFTASTLRQNQRRNDHLPFRTYSGTRYIGGYSDHFPVVLKIDHN